jgi:hypothetical protein
MRLKRSDVSRNSQPRRSSDAAEQTGNTRRRRLRGRVGARRFHFVDDGIAAFFQDRPDARRDSR